MNGTRNRSLIAVGILLALVLSVFGVLAMMVAETEAARAELDNRQAELEVLKRRPLTAPNGATAALSGNPFLEGATLALAANGLQQRLVGLVDSTGGTLRSVAVEPPAELAEGGQNRRALVQATASMSISALQTLLYRLESETPFVFVEGLTVQRIEQPRGGRTDEDGNDGEASREEQMLNVDLRVAGFWRGTSS
jgi:general secretion pathway protein M